MQTYGKSIKTNEKYVQIKFPKKAFFEIFGLSCFHCIAKFNLAEVRAYFFEILAQPVAFDPNSPTDTNTRDYSG